MYLIGPADFGVVVNKSCEVLQPPPARAGPQNPEFMGWDSSE